MTRYIRISTLVAAASSLAMLSGRTLKPMMMALEASARSTSDLLMAPTPAWMTRTRTSSLDSFSRDCLTASAEPWTSALTTMASSFMSFWAIWVNRLSRVTFWKAENCFSRAAAARFSASSRARRSSSTASNRSPASGTAVRPVISTGVEGPAEVMVRPLSSRMVRTRPTAVPAISTSPARRVPFWTSRVATGPWPLSRRASTTAPLPRRLGLAFSSMTSASRTIRSSRSLMPWPVRAETGMQAVSPPHSSAIRPYLVRSSMTRSGLAVGLSILLMATITLTSAALAWLMDSMVWGMMPSSAATTSTAISVMLAPRARIEVNASWPGVSRKVMRSSPTLTW